MRKKIFIISIITFLIDMLTKYFIKDLVIIKNFFEFKRVINNGAAWSILSSKRLMLILIGVCAIYFIIKLHHINLAHFHCCEGGIVGFGGYTGTASRINADFCVWEKCL